MTSRSISAAALGVKLSETMDKKHLNIQHGHYSCPCSMLSCHLSPAGGFKTNSVHIKFLYTNYSHKNRKPRLAQGYGEFSHRSNICSLIILPIAAII
jgi:hypothetical protein